MFIFKSRIFSDVLFGGSFRGGAFSYSGGGMVCGLLSGVVRGAKLMEKVVPFIRGETDPPGLPRGQEQRRMR